jgi:hypothetical protein
MADTPVRGPLGPVDAALMEESADHSPVVGRETVSALAAVLPAALAEARVGRVVLEEESAALAAAPVAPTEDLSVSQAGFRAAPVERPDPAVAAVGLQVLVVAALELRDLAGASPAERPGQKAVGSAVGPVQESHSTRCRIRTQRTGEQAYEPHRMCWPRVGVSQAVRDPPPDGGARHRLQVRVLVDSAVARQASEEASLARPLC